MGVNPVRGRRVSHTARKEIDIVLVAIRQEPESGRLLMAQGFERKGAVWGDVRLLRREWIIERINEGKKVVTGRRADLVGDFEMFDAVFLNPRNGENTLYTGTEPTKDDDLGAPFF